MRKLIILVCVVSGCAQVEPRPPPEVRIEYRTVYIDKVIPCFTEAERPRMAAPTAVDIDRATVDQLAAALAADMENERLFAAAVDSLFMKCQGVKP